MPFTPRGDVYDRFKSLTIVPRLSSFALHRRAVPRSLALPTARLATIGLLGMLVLVSAAIKIRFLESPFWIDEGLSVGIASFPLLEIPGALRQDGSPPLYYMLLSVWTDLFGDGENATHALSLIFALATVPVAWWAGRSLWSDRAGWVCAALFAVSRFVTTYAHETRMYALIMLLALVACAAFLHVFVHGRRRYLPLFAGALALMLYTHNWSLFFGVAAGLAFLLVLHQRREHRRALLRDGALAFGAVSLLFAPWVPTLLFQAAHTGAPWSNVPNVMDLLKSVLTVLGGPGPAVGLVLVAGAGLAEVLRRGTASPERTSALVLVVFALGTLLIAFGTSQVSPAWAVRYLAVVVSPLLLLAGVGLARAGRLGAVTLGLVALIWSFGGAGVGPGPTQEKFVTKQVDLRLDPGDTVLVTHPERVPVVDYYLKQDLRYASTLGPVPDKRIFDWRDALDRLKASRVDTTLQPMLRRIPVGDNLLLVRPVTRNNRSWRAPWTRLVRKRSERWAKVIQRDPRFLRRAAVPMKLGGATTGVRATLYTKVAG